jgi:hypothetical protein
MTNRSIERVTFLNDVICAAVEGGIGYWASTSNYDWGTDKGKFSLDGTPYPTTVTVYEEENESNVVGFPLDIDRVASAIQKIIRGEAIVGNGDGGQWDRPLGEYSVKLIAGASATNDAGDIDADQADIIVQVAVLGSVVYG